MVNCKDCPRDNALTGRDYRKRNPDKSRDSSRKQYLNNSEKKKAKSRLRDARRRAAGTEGVYFISDGEYVKVGFSSAVEMRIVDMQVGNPRELKCLGVLAGPRSLESQIHDDLRHLHVRGEWYHLHQEVLSKIGSSRWVS